MNSDYKLWYSSESDLTEKLIKHCDKKIDAYFEVHAKKQDKILAENRKHNKVVEQYLKTFVSLVRKLK
jgi:hypothetical protein